MSKTAQTKASAEDSDLEFYKALNIQAGPAPLIRQMLKFNIAMDQPVGIFGRAGIGKTELVKQVAEELDMDLCVLFLHHMDKEDISGFPFPDPSDERSVLMRVKKILPKQRSKRKGTILFLDEWNRADRAVVNAMFTIMEKPRRAGDLELPDDVRIVLSGNPSDSLYSVNEAEKEPAIRRRVNWVGMTTSVGAWLEHAGKVGYHHGVISYMRAHKQALYDLEAHNSGQVAACPATWEKVSRAVQHAEKTGGIKSNESVLRAVLSGYIGVRMATDFMTELLQLDGESIDPDEVLGGFKEGTDIYKRVQKMVKDRAGGASGKIATLAQSIALTIATTKPAPLTVASSVAVFASLLEGDLAQKFLADLTKSIQEQDTPDQAYLKSFSNALRTQEAYQETRKRMAQKSSSMQKALDGGK